MRVKSKQGKTVDFLLTAKRDKAAAMRFFDKAMKAGCVPEKVTMDKSGANKAAMVTFSGTQLGFVALSNLRQKILNEISVS